MRARRREGVAAGQVRSGPSARTGPRGGRRAPPASEAAGGTGRARVRARRLLIYLTSPSSLSRCSLPRSRISIPRLGLASPRVASSSFRLVFIPTPFLPFSLPSGWVIFRCGFVPTRTTTEGDRERETAGPTGRETEAVGGYTGNLVAWAPRAGTRRWRARCVACVRGVLARGS